MANWGNIEIFRLLPYSPASDRLRGTVWVFPNFWQSTRLPWIVLSGRLNVFCLLVLTQRMERIRDCYDSALYKCTVNNNNIVNNAECSVSDWKLHWQHGSTFSRCTSCLFLFFRRPVQRTNDVLYSLVTSCIRVWQDSWARGGRCVVSLAACQQGLHWVPRGRPWSPDGRHASWNSGTIRQRTGRQQLFIDCSTCVCL